MPNVKIIGFSIEAANLRYGDAVVDLCNAIRSVPAHRPNELVELLGAQAEGLRRISRLKDSEELFRKCLRLSIHEGLLTFQGWAFWGLASVLRAKGHRSQSAQLYQHALASARLSGDRRCELWAVAELSELDRMAGLFRRAIEVHLVLRKEFCRIGDSKGVCWAALGVAQIHRLLRSLDRASTEFTRALDTSEEVGNAVGAGWAVRGQAEVARERKDYSLSLVLATDCRERFQTIGYSLGAAYALKTLVDSYTDIGDFSAAAPLAAQCLEEFEACGEARGIGFALLTVGRLNARMKQIGTATAFLQRSAALLRLSSGSEPAVFSASAELARLGVAVDRNSPVTMRLTGNQERQFVAHIPAKQPLFQLRSENFVIE